MEYLVTALSSSLPCGDPHLGTNGFMGSGVVGRRDENIVLLHCPLFLRGLSRKGVYIFRISMFCFSLVNVHLKLLYLVKV